MDSLGDRLRELRGNRSLYEVGKGSGLCAKDIYRYEEGQCFPTAQNLKKLAAYFGVPYEEFQNLYYDSLFMQPEELEILVEWVFQGKRDRTQQYTFADKRSTLSSNRHQRP